MLIYPINVSSEIYESSDVFPSSQKLLFFRACLLEVFKNKRCCTASWDWPLRNYTPSIDWILPFAKLFSALPETKTEQLWQCNSIKRAYLISLVSCLKCFWSQYPNHLLSCDSSSATLLGSAFTAGSTAASLQTEEPAFLQRSAREAQVSKRHEFPINAGATQTPSSDTAALWNLPVPSLPNGSVSTAVNYAGRDRLSLWSTQGKYGAGLKHHQSMVRSHQYFWFHIAFHCSEPLFLLFGFRQLEKTHAFTTAEISNAHIKYMQAAEIQNQMTFLKSKLRNQPQTSCQNVLT